MSSPLGRFRGLLLIVRRSLRQHALSTFVTVTSVALAAGLVMAVFGVNQQARNAFTGGPVGFDAVLGARGSQAQLVLNTIFHLETSPGNIPWSLYEEMREDRRVETAVPYAVGDNYRSYRIVGTTLELFTELEFHEGRAFAVRPGGRLFDPLRREAVVGSVVAERLGLQVGSRINAYHGVVFDEKKKHDDEYVVVGLLEPTNSPSDRVIWIPIEGVFRMNDHVLRGTGEEFRADPTSAIPAEHKEVSAIMLVLRGMQTGVTLDHTINKQGKVATLAWPIGTVVAQLFDKLGWAIRILEIVAYLVVAVAAGSILASIYNTMNERRREFAILRSLGASRSTVSTVIVLEAGTIALLGSVLGFLVYAAIFAVTGVVVRRSTGVVLDPAAFHPALVLVPVGMTILGALSGLAPALKAYSTDVASNLVPGS